MTSIHKKISQCNSIQELNNLLLSTTPTMSMLYGRRFVINGCEDSARYNEILDKASQLFKSLNNDDTPIASHLLKNLMRKKVTGMQDNQDKKPFSFYQLCSNIVYSIKKLFGNIGRENKLSQMTEYLLQKDARTIENLPFKFQLEYCKNHPKVMQYARPWVQKTLILDNPKILSFASNDVKELFNLKHYGVTFIFSGVNADDLELEDGTKQIQINENQNTTLNDIANYLIRKICQIENHNGEIIENHVYKNNYSKDKLNASVTLKDKDLMFSLGEEGFEEDELIIQSFSKNCEGSELYMDHENSCFQKIIDNFIRKGLVEKSPLQNSRCKVYGVSLPKKVLNAKPTNFKSL